MNQHKKKSGRISYRIIIVSFFAILLVAFSLTYICLQSLVTAYEKKYNDMTLFCNRVVASDISGDAILPYIELLRNNEQIKAKQIEYGVLRKSVYELEELGYENNSGKIRELQEQMSLFKAQMQEYKDENYNKMQYLLNDLKASSGAKYLYIFAETGVPGCYTYIFDAHTAEETDDLDIDDFGTVDAKEGLEMIAQVLESGRQMEEAVFYQNGMFGRLNYACAPIKDSNGNTVAVVGTDMDLKELGDELVSVLRINILIFILISIAALGVTYWVLHRMVLKPINKLVAIGADITGGKIYTEIPLRLQNRRDEIGKLAQTYQSVINSFQEMMLSTEQLLKSAMSGRLTARSDPSRFQGEFSYLLEQFNATLEIIERYSDNIPAALIIMDLELVPLYSNRSFAEIFGQEISTQDLAAVLTGGAKSGADKDGLKDRFAALVREDNYNTTAWIDLKGVRRCMSFVCCKWEVGVNPKGFLLVASDITELMLEKEKALEASRAKSDFLSRVSHELRTPLNTIVGMSQLGLQDEAVTSQSAKRLANISDASRHLLDIINDVLDMSQIEAGKAVMRTERFSLRELLGELEDLISVQAKERELEFTIRAADDVPAVLVGDAVRLKQVLINLTGNALKFTEAGGSITVEISVSGHRDGKSVLLFRVTDTGVGMSPEFLQKIFAPFEQEDKYLKRRYKGTGLGLSISFGLISLMGGSIDVRSELGKGSEFLITLPFGTARTEDGKPLPDHSRDEALPCVIKSGVKVMLVDDIDINREILTEILCLSFENIEVIESADGADALDKFKNSAYGEFDLIFMDVQMPKMDGYTCTRQIRALNRPDAASVPIVALTANAFKEDQENAIEAGMNDYLSKPVDMEKCNKIVMRYCG